MTKIKLQEEAKIQDIKDKIAKTGDNFTVQFKKKDGTDRSMVCSKIALAKWFEKREVKAEKETDKSKKPTRKIPEGNIFVMEVTKEDKLQTRSIVLSSIFYLETDQGIYEYE